MTQKLSGQYNNKPDDYKNNEMPKTQEHLLNYLFKHPNRNGKQISRKVDSLSESTIQKHIRKLKKKDLIQTTSTDGYILTDKGVERIE